MIIDIDDPELQPAFEKMGIGGVPEDAPAKLSSWLFEKAEDLPEVGFSFEYLSVYTSEDEETNEYKDYSKMLKISVAEVLDHRITMAKIEVRDATEEEIAAYKEEEEED